MDKYVTGNIIKELREKNNLTQSDLGNLLNVSDKTISKWETGKGYPDITMLEPLSKAFNVSINELLSGNTIENTNTNGNILRSKFYICPVCGNVIFSLGEANIICHGISLVPEAVNTDDEKHLLNVENVEDEYYTEMNHQMTKDHYISFLAAVNYEGIEIVKLYPEGNAEARFKRRGVKYIYSYCNKHGLYRKKI